MKAQLIAPLTRAASHCLDASRETFTATHLPEIPNSIGYAGAFAGVIGNYLVAGGGANFPDGVMPWNGGKKVWHDTLYALDLSAQESGWKLIGRLPKPNGYGISLSCKEGVVMIGGGDATQHFNEVWLLTLMADGRPVFRSMPELPISLAQMSGALVGRRIHVCGGMETSDASIASNSHWMLDLDSLENGWQEMPALPAVGRILASAAAMDDAFYLIGGCSLAADAIGKVTRTLLREAWKFSTGRWSRVADLPYPLVAAASPAPAVGKSAFLISGDDGKQAGITSPDHHTGFSKEVLCYHSEEDRWTSAGKLDVQPPVTVAVTEWNNQFILFNGEVRPGVRTPQVFSFIPCSYGISRV